MIPAPRSTTRLMLLLCIAACGGLVGAMGQTPDPDSEGDSGLSLPPGLEIKWQGTLKQTAEGAAEFTGPVTLSWRESRIQADRLLLRDGRHIQASGNVLIVWGENRIYGERLTYDLETERGIIEDAIGYALDEYLIVAKSIEKIGDRKLHLKSGTITTCSQPLPYWTFAVTSATITLEQYARMWNVRLRVLRVPVVYLPYLIWPVKDGRAAGLLMPEFHTTSNRGDVISQQLFIPLGRSADMTLVGRYYTKAGFGGGGDVRFIPNQKGQGYFGGFYIDDQVSQEDRYRVDYRQTQEFRNGFRMVANMNVVSDPDYFIDFERDLDVASSPDSRALLEFSRNGRWASLNIRELRDEQLSTGLVQQSLPEVEVRGSSRRLGGSPFYLSFESSVATLRQVSTTLQADYYRGDVVPRITLPISPAPWLDLTPRVAYRYTYWTQHLFDGELEDEPLTRELLSYGLDAIGPKVYRKFGNADGRARFKHSIEPQVSYGFDEQYDRINDVILFDDVDRIAGAGTRLAYSLVQRLFARKPQHVPKTSVTEANAIVLPDGTTYDLPEAEEQPQPAGESAVGQPTVPLEVATLSISQARSYDEDLSFADLDGDGVTDASSPYTPVQLTGRVSPGERFSMDIRTSYDILYNRMRDVSLSGGVRDRLGSLQFSLFRRQGLGVQREFLDDGTEVFVPADSNTTVRVLGGFRALRDKLRFNLEAAYESDPGPGTTHFPEQHYQLIYSTQCCTFLFERLTRDFGGAESRREFYFQVDLRGVGKLLETTF